jgi:hypothetical protein
MREQKHMHPSIRACKYYHTVSMTERKKKQMTRGRKREKVGLLERREEREKLCLRERREEREKVGFRERREERETLS